MTAMTKDFAMIAVLPPKKEIGSNLFLNDFGG
jgi:hypothetical protein